MADTSLLFNIIGKDRTGPAFRSAADGASKLGSKMKAGIMAGAAALGVAAVGAAAFGKQAIEIASDTNEASSKVIQLLGDMSDGALEFAETSATAYGMSKREALNSVGAMAAVDRAMGTSKSEAAKLALEYTKLSADLGSFNNASSAEVQEALTASLSGEYEMLKKYGIVVNDTTLAAEAQRIGMEKQGSTWTTAQKRILSHNIILASTKAAQGDFARTSGGLANQQKILAARFEDLKGELGAKLLPVAIKVAGWLIKMIDVVAKFGQKLAPVGRAVSVFFKALGGGSEANEFSGNLRKVNNVGVKLGNWIRNDFLPAAKKFASWLKNEAIPAARDFAVKLWNDLQPTIKQLGKTLRDDIIPAVRGFIQKFREAWPTIKRVLNILGDIAGFILRRVVPVLVRFYGKYLATVIRVFGQVFRAGWKVVGFLVDLGQKVINAGKKFWDFVTDVKDAITDFKNKVKSGIDKVVNWFKDLPKNIVDGIGDVGEKLVQKGKDFIEGFGKGAEEKARSLPFGMGKVIGWAIDGVKTAADMHSPSRLMMKYGRWFVEGFAIGIKDKSQDVIDKAVQLVDKLKEKLAEVKDFAKQIRDSFAAFADVTSIDTVISGEGGDTEGGFAKLLSDLQGRADNAQKFNSALGRLRKMGLNYTTLAQLREAGPESGLKSAEQILGAGSVGVGQVNAAVKSILASGTALGNREAKALYGIDPSKPQKLKVTVGGDIKITTDIASFIKVLRKEIRVQGGDVQKVLGKA